MAMHMHVYKYSNMYTYVYIYMATDFYSVLKSVPKPGGAYDGAVEIWRRQKPTPRGEAPEKCLSIMT